MHPFTIGLFIFPRVTQLDFTGPYEVFSRLAGARVLLVARVKDPVRSEYGLTVLPDVDFSTVPPLDLICVPGGPGINDVLRDPATLAFLARAGKAAGWVTSVCTGALALGGAGLLTGYRATTHWLYLDILRKFTDQVATERVVVDRNRITGGGITAGIDLALRVVAELRGAPEAERIQLMMEYNPDPPFRAGHPSVADPAVVAAVRGATADALRTRAEIVAGLLARGRSE